ncbi:MAG: flavodoxin domain-containing protein [Saprospiraceae bacterium]|nr:flavodoxin domain-containing protein [Saprospiraceae bacterium]MBK7438182.1 flavodoxin domain-containing protein [Saprospiraceae bacterium]MBK9679345.1 flavodoxin domain-containing protein [Saprospiraceae bacterium]MBK9930368.1 flavodoxin domain-containing protein [Saprospiraceae bacterium]MBP7923309.1 flavodoxin domain-containing protein [Saprospiraceae bacterium]
MLSEGKLRTLNDFIEKTSKEELIWINGYISGLISTSMPKDSGAVIQKRFTILYGTDTGNSKKLAMEFNAAGKKQGAKVKVASMDTYKAEDLLQEKSLAIILSTHGDGDPPPSAKKFFDHLMSTDQKYPDLEFAVLALGDTSYPMYCKAGEDVHHRLIELGATAVFPIQKCDVDYQADAANWYDLYLKSFPTEPIKTVAVQAPKASGGKKFYAGIIKTNINLNAAGSNKRTHHIEIKTIEPILYEPGDALGVMPKNNEETLEKLFAILPVDPNLNIPYKGAGHTLMDLLTNKLNICHLKESQVQKYADIVGQAIPKVRMDLLDLMRIYPMTRPAQFIEFVHSLTEMLPRLYSICSSPQVREYEIHILVGKNTFTIEEEKRFGLASDMLSSLEEGSALDFYIHRNKSFRLPAPDTDIILIGPGTGIAPMRSFIEERDAAGGSGRNWLIFGEQHFTTDFFYQTEIQQYASSGTLQQIDLAWSRDQKEKIYVQDKIKAKSKELYDWIKNGAHIFVSGTRSPMSEDVEKAMIEVIYAHSGKSAPESEAYWNDLKESGIYKADVY